MNVLAHQNMLDIALQTFGDARSCIDIAEENQFNVTDLLSAGMELKIPSQSTLTNADVQQYYKNKSIQPATSEPLLMQNTSDVFFGFPILLC